MGNNNNSSSNSSSSSSSNSNNNNSGGRGSISTRVKTFAYSIETIVSAAVMDEMRCDPFSSAAIWRTSA